jgi:carbamoyl-phosphate synthase small subunit
MKPAKLVLEDGSVYPGNSLGAEGEVFGEVVFNTSMTGYQEILTDPSYKGQIVAMTYPLIGNYGTNAEDIESIRPHVEGFAVRESSRRSSNLRARSSLQAYLAQHGIVGIEGVDTRALVRHIRTRGAMKGVLSTVDLDDASLVGKAVASPGLVGRDLVKEVVPTSSARWTEGFTSRFAPSSFMYDDWRGGPAETRPHVVALDFGMKWNIARHLVESGCRITVLPGTVSGQEVLSLHPDGVFLSNGPGDPSALDYAVQAIRMILTHAEQSGMPVFGICLGHQLLGQAWGAETFKLKFGHRGANQPVLNKLTGRVEITTQNHGFAVAPETLPNYVECTHFNLNDHTLEGMRHKKLAVFGVQYHPEASAGPHDSAYLFAEFRRMIASHVGSGSPSGGSGASRQT